ncbi:MAG: hypothetical protein JRD93_17390 [Deltaproteobacteria bacterium]|nr:hypothetical protein [Deltaproteobacteria bacterium]MBW2663698.1 hypothetical protein [Deltaproteobacteria bacterium]
MKSIFKAAVLSLGLLTAVSFAYAGSGKGVKDGTGPKNTAAQRGPNYVDQNGDGICDNVGARVDSGYRPGYRCGKGYGAGKQARGKGLCRGLRDGKGSINRAGVAKPNYVDADGDGICDNFQSK